MININKEKLIKRLFLFNLIAIGVTLIALFVAIFAFGSLTRPYIDIMFSDFYDVMKFVLSSNAYDASMSSSYPPLAILILYPFAFICRKVINFDGLVLSEITGNLEFTPAARTELLQTPQFWISIVLFYTIFFVAAALLLKKITGFKGRKLAFFLLMVFSFGTIIYTTARGNILISAFVFLLFFLAFYKSENKVLRELALIGLAISGAIKIYPLFFGVLLLKDKKFFSAIRVAIYTLTLFFVPFLCFEGGFSNLELFIKNLLEFSSGDSRLLLPLNMSSSGLIYKLFYIFEWIFCVSLSGVSQVVSMVTIAVIMLFAIIGVILSKSKLSALMLCSAIVILIPPVSYYYSALLLLIPMTEFVAGHENLDKRKKRFYLIIFMAVSFIVTFLFCFVFGLVFVVFVFYESIKNIKNYFREKQKIDRGGAI